jgi:hypothetical protein
MRTPFFVESAPTVPRVNVEVLLVRLHMHDWIGYTVPPSALGLLIYPGTEEDTHHELCLPNNQLQILSSLTQRLPVHRNGQNDLGLIER